ncbi:MAG: hypothetical protein R2724_11725 [Bryobacterales bacterium]
MTRREFLAASAASVATLRAADSWQAGDVAHLLPAANDRRILLKASFRRALAEPPKLLVGKRKVAGARIRPAATGASMQTVCRRVRSIGWRSKTTAAAPCATLAAENLPALDARPERLRLPVYTCAGGDERVHASTGGVSFLSIARRQRLFDRALTFQPDAAIGNGDHTYWDLYRTGFRRAMAMTSCAVRSASSIARCPSLARPTRTCSSTLAKRRSPASTACVSARRRCSLPRTTMTISRTMKPTTRWSPSRPTI